VVEVVAGVSHVVFFITKDVLLVMCSWPGYVGMQFWLVLGFVKLPVLSHRDMANYVVMVTCSCGVSWHPKWYSLVRESVAMVFWPFLLI
jgi:hypothetical protein